MFGRDAAGAGDRLSEKFDAVFLYLTEHGEGELWRERTVDVQRVSADTLRKRVMHGCEIDAAFQNPKTTFDVGKRLVAVDNTGRFEVGVGNEREFAVDLLGNRDRVLVDVEAEVIGVEISLQDAARSGGLHHFAEALIDHAVGGYSAALGTAGIFVVEALGETFAFVADVRDVGASPRVLSPCRGDIMHNHQALRLPGGLSTPVGARGVTHELGELALAPTTHREDVLDRQAIRCLQALGGTVQQWVPEAFELYPSDRCESLCCADSSSSDRLLPCAGAAARTITHAAHGSLAYVASRGAQVRHQSINHLGEEIGLILHPQIWCTRRTHRYGAKACV